VYQKWAKLDTIYFSHKFWKFLWLFDHYFWSQKMQLWGNILWPTTVGPLGVRSEKFFRTTKFVTSKNPCTKFQLNRRKFRYFNKKITFPPPTHDFDRYIVIVIIRIHIAVFLKALQSGPQCAKLGRNVIHCRPTFYKYKHWNPGVILRKFAKPTVEFDEFFIKLTKSKRICSI
jgi:hypothetical protein